MSLKYNKQYVPTMEQFTEFAEEDKRGRHYMFQTIRQAMGNPADYSGSADWGGIPVWPLTGDRFVGKFLVLDDNDDAVLLKRELTGVGQDEYLDTEIELGKPENLADIIKKAKDIRDRQQ